MSLFVWCDLFYIYAQVSMLYVFAYKFLISVIRAFSCNIKSLKLAKMILILQVIPKPKITSHIEIEIVEIAQDEQNSGVINLAKKISKPCWILSQANCSRKSFKEVENIEIEMEQPVINEGKCIEVITITDHIYKTIFLANGRKNKIKYGYF